ncbi:MAG: SUF system FeS assembly protein, NifU family [Parcubacteria group bacterium GW2011_GWA2_45_30]|nr:MAG: SUF system FeS assembly protein, NifU family [Parcubacteria group bacterium GW2011_GWA2_45_30]
MPNSIYHDFILSHHRNPQNYGLALNFDIEIKGSNMICGDSMYVRLKFDGDSVMGVSFESDSCVVSRAAASLTSEYIKGKTRDEIWAIPPEKVAELLQILLTPSRMKCATLFLDTIRKAI